MSARIGIDLGGTKISGVVLDDAGREAARVRRATPTADYEATVAALAGVVADLETECDLSPGQCPVGIGTPGCWHPRLGSMKNCNSTWLNDRPLLRDLEDALGTRVRLANDADCLAQSEASDGAGRDAHVVFAAILGTGVGGGWNVGGLTLSGPNGLSGEWGHVPLPYFRQAAFPRPDAADRRQFQLESRLRDRQCYCGRLNCIETFLSGPGLAATHAELWNEDRSPSTIAERADAESAQSWELYQHMLARSLAQMVNVMDPGVIVLGGGLSKVAELYPALALLVPAYAFSSVAHTDDVRVAIRQASWGDDSGVRGAARLWGVGQ